MCYDRTMPDFFTKTFYVYMTASGPRRVIYVGMSSDLIVREGQHRDRILEGFTKTYWVDRLVYFGAHETAASAQKREYLMQRWRRAWKIERIETINPTWADLYPEVLRMHGLAP